MKVAWKHLSEQPSVGILPLAVLEKAGENKEITYVVHPCHHEERVMGADGVDRDRHLAQVSVIRLAELCQPVVSYLWYRDDTGLSVIVGDFPQALHTVIQPVKVGVELSRVGVDPHQSVLQEIQLLSVVSSKFPFAIVPLLPSDLLRSSDLVGGLDEVDDSEGDAADCAVTRVLT
jgi:hypothetical protein